MKKNTRVTALSTGVLMLFVLFVVAQDASAQMGSRQGGGMQGANMIDENNNGVPDGMDDDDGDGIINRDDDDDHEKDYVNKGDGDGMQYRNQVQNREVVMEDDVDDIAPVRGLQRGDAEPAQVQVQKRAQEQQQEQQIGAGDGAGQMRGNGEQAMGAAQVEKRMQQRVNNPDVGEQVRVMAREQVQRQDAIEENVRAAQRSGMAQFFMGADKEKMNAAREELGQYNKDLAQMKGLYAQGELAPDDAVQMKNQIQTMEQVRTQLDQQIEEGEGFSLFGWLAGLTS